MASSDTSFGSLSSSYFLVDQLVDGIQRENFSKVMSLARSKKVDWNVVLPEYGAAPMHFLAGMENEGFAVAVLDRALKDGGDPNVRMEDGLTPVHLAAMWGRCRILQALLTNGGDPELVDWSLCLNAEQFALKEHQFQAYGVLSTYSVIADNVDHFSKYISNETSPETSPRADIGLNTYEDDRILSENDGAPFEGDWLKRTVEHLPVNAKAMDLKKEHRRGTRLNEQPKSTSYKKIWENVLSELPKRNTKESIYENYHESNDNDYVSGTLKEIDNEASSYGKNGTRPQPIYEEIKGNYGLDEGMYGVPKKHNKGKALPNFSEESELYLQGFEEVAYKTVDSRPRSRPSRSSATATVRSEDSAYRDKHNRVLCQMSRIYLFMLKKRRTLFKEENKV